MTDTKIMPKDIHAKWSKLNEADLATVRTPDALSALVAKGYALEKGKADAEVKAWVGNRSF
jgi:hypothetical protein